MAMPVYVHVCVCVTFKQKSNAKQAAAAAANTQQEKRATVESDNCVTFAKYRLASKQAPGSDRIISKF